MPSRRFSAIPIVYATATGPAEAASSSIPVNGLSLAAAAAIALVGLVFLAVGLFRLAGSSGAAARFRFLGPLGRFGGEGRAIEAGPRRAVTSILVGIALLGLPDLLGAGVTSQMRIVYQQSRTPQAGYVTGSDIKSKETSRTYSDANGGSEGLGGAFSFPWWLLGVAGLFLLIAGGVRLFAGGGVRSGPTASRLPGGAERIQFQTGEDGFVADSDLHRELESGGVEAISAPTRSVFEILFETIERLKERIRKLLKTAREQLRRLADETEEQKGRFRPLAAFAVQQAAALFRALADRDDGGSGLPRAEEVPDPRATEDEANAMAYAERVGSILSLQGADLVGQIAKALTVSRKRFAADLHRLGATGAPGNWVRVVNVDAGREWILAERHIKIEDRRFEGVVRFDQVDWFATLSIQNRPSNLGLIVVPLPGHHVYLISVRDGRAEALADGARERIRLPDGGSWTLADLPLERVARHFGDGSDGRWMPAPDGPSDEILVFDIQAKRIVVVSGADRLHRALASEENPVRALVHVQRGAALAFLGVTISDVVPPE